MLFFDESGAFCFRFIQVFPLVVEPIDPYHLTPWQPRGLPLGMVSYFHSLLAIHAINPEYYPQSSVYMYPSYYQQPHTDTNTS